MSFISVALRLGIKRKSLSLPKSDINKQYKFLVKRLCYEETTCFVCNESSIPANQCLNEHNICLLCSARLEQTAFASGLPFQCPFCGVSLFSDVNGQYTRNEAHIIYPAETNIELACKCRSTLFKEQNVDVHERFQCIRRHVHGRTKWNCSNLEDFKLKKIQVDRLCCPKIYDEAIMHIPEKWDDVRFIKNQFPDHYIIRFQFTLDRLISSSILSDNLLFRSKNMEILNLHDCRILMQVDFTKEKNGQVFYKVNISKFNDNSTARNHPLNKVLYTILTLKCDDSNEDAFDYAFDPWHPFVVEASTNHMLPGTSRPSDQHELKRLDDREIGFFHRSLLAVFLVALDDTIFHTTHEAEENKSVISYIS